MTKKQIEEVIEEIFGSWNDGACYFEDHVVNELYKRYGTKETKENKLYVPKNQLSLFPPVVSKTADEMFLEDGWTHPRIKKGFVQYQKHIQGLTLTIFKNNKIEFEMCDDEDSSVVVNISTLNAIGKKCQELGWL